MLSSIIKLSKALRVTPEELQVALQDTKIKIQWDYANEETKFWKHSYKVYLSNTSSDYYIVNADHEQDALDYAVDAAEEAEQEGYFLDTNSKEFWELEQVENVTYAGNHGRALVSSDISIIKLD